MIIILSTLDDTQDLSGKILSKEYMFYKMSLRYTLTYIMPLRYIYTSNIDIRSKSLR